MVACEKHETCRASGVAVRRWMRLHKADHRDPLTNEVNATMLAESAAAAFDHDEWLDDSTHDVWDWAAEVASPV